MEKLASLDLGTNTFRLLIGQPQEGGLRRLLVENRITRLGEDLKEGAPLHPQALERSLSALSELRTRMDSYGVSRHRAVGTSALRRATDSSAFVGLAYGWKALRLAAQAETGVLTAYAMRVGGSF